MCHLVKVVCVFVSPWLTVVAFLACLCRRRRSSFVALGDFEGSHGMALAFPSS